MAGRARVDYCFWGGLVPDNFGQLEGLDEKGCAAFKSFLGPVSPDYAPLSYGQAYEAMEIIEKFGGRAGFHCEDISTIQWLEKRMKEQGRLDWQAFLDSRPVAAEKIATLAVIEIARATGCKAHICHVSCPEVAEVIRQAQREGLDITAETCAHYLCMTQEDLLQKGPLFKCAPPLRSAAQRDGLWEYVADGTFSGIASDHSPCTWQEKHTQILGRRIEKRIRCVGRHQRHTECVPGRLQRRLPQTGAAAGKTGAGHVRKAGPGLWPLGSQGRPFARL